MPLPLALLIFGGLVVIFAPQIVALFPSKQGLLTQPVQRPVDPKSMKIGKDYYIDGKTKAFFVEHDMWFPYKYFDFRVRGVTDPHNPDDVLTLTYQEVATYVSEQPE